MTREKSEALHKVIVSKYIAQFTWNHSNSFHMKLNISYQLLTLPSRKQNRDKAVQRQTKRYHKRGKQSRVQPKAHKTFSHALRGSLAFVSSSTSDRI